MKQLSVLISVAILLSGCAAYMPFKLYERDGKLLGILPLVNGKVIYRERVEVPELPKEEVFRRARRWCVLAYRSAKDVIQLIDKDTGEIIGKGFSTVDGIPVYHTITVDVSEDAYDVTVRDLNVNLKAVGTGIYSVGERNYPIEGYSILGEKGTIEFFRQTDNDISTTLKSLHAYIKKPTP